MSKVTDLYAEDEAFREVADLLFGGGMEISKANPDQSDIAAQKKRHRTQARVGLATNVIGITAGTAATAESVHRLKAARKEGGKAQPFKNLSRAGKLKRLSVPAAGLAGAGLALQSANLGGDMIANRVLSRAASEPKKKVRKNFKELKEKTPTKGKFAAVAVDQSKKGFKKLECVKKNEFDVTWSGEISKVDSEKKQVFGWASVVEMNGEPVVDLQGDYITIDEVEKSAYDYVHKSRKGGDMHLRDHDGSAISKSHMIESLVVTKDKKKALGLSDDTPTGWWVGYQINDDDLWGKVKGKERTAFSIHGRGVRD